MSKSPITKIFERDPDQSGTPVGHVAYLLRWWRAVYETGIVTKVAIGSFGLPHLSWNSGGSMRRPRYLGELTRVFVRDDAEIDPAVFEIDAGPIPADALTRDWRKKH